MRRNRQDKKSLAVFQIGTTGVRAVSGMDATMKVMWRKVWNVLIGLLLLSIVWIVVTAVIIAIYVVVVFIM